MERFSLRGMWLCVVALLLTAAIGGCGSGEDVAQGEETNPETAAALERVELDALETYPWYLERQIFDLLKVTEQLRSEIARGDTAKAALLYERARVLYGHVAPAARLFPSLARRIDGYVEEFPDGEFSGFHRIEQGIAAQRTTKGLEPVANQLIADLRQLKQAIKGSEMQAQQVAEAAADLMREVSDRWLARKQQPYANYDLVDLSARVEGAQKAYETVRPLLLISSLDLVADAEVKFVYCYDMLSAAGQSERSISVPAPNAGTFFIPSSDIRKQNVEEKFEALDELAEVLREAQARLVA